MPLVIFFNANVRSFSKTVSKEKFGFRYEIQISDISENIGCFDYGLWYKTWTELFTLEWSAFTCEIKKKYNTVYLRFKSLLTSQS